jgi:hypothetical protein
MPVNEVQEALDRSAKYIERLKKDPTASSALFQILIAQHDAIAELAKVIKAMLRGGR